MNASTKEVHFAEEECMVHYYEPPVDSIDSEQMRTSDTRQHLEQCLLKDPKTQLDHMINLVAAWRTRPVSVVFGNLGRQPHLLDYYLDLCMGPEEKVKVVCDWELPTAYQTSVGKGSDFLICVEPYFGYPLLRDPTVQHLVVLTSHLCLEPPEEETGYYELYLSDSPLPDPQEPATAAAAVPFTPPLFHTQLVDDSIPPPDEAVLLDVSGAKSAREAFLRLLTGHEMIRPRPFKIRRLSPNTERVLRANLAMTRDRWRTLFRDSAPEDSDPYSYLGIH